MEIGTAPALRGEGWGLLWGDAAVLEQEVSVGLQLVSVSSSGAGLVVTGVWCVLCRKSWSLCTFGALPVMF